jgi:transcription termination factor NusB
MENSSSIIYIILGLGAIAGTLKGVDWLIAQKYQTIKECETCREALNEKQTEENLKLASIETKLELFKENIDKVIENQEKIKDFILNYYKTKE